MWSKKWEDLNRLYKTWKIWSFESQLSRLFNNNIDKKKMKNNYFKKDNNQKYFPNELFLTSFYSSSIQSNLGSFNVFNLDMVIVSSIILLFFFAFNSTDCLYWGFFFTSMDRSLLNLPEWTVNYFFLYFIVL